VAAGKQGSQDDRAGESMRPAWHKEPFDGRLLVHQAQVQAADLRWIDRRLSRRVNSEQLFLAKKRLRAVRASESSRFMLGRPLYRIRLEPARDSREDIVRA